MKNAKNKAMVIGAVAGMVLAIVFRDKISELLKLN